MNATSLLCRDASERERLLDMSRRLRPANRRSMALIAIAAVVSIPAYGWAMQVPFLLAAGVFALTEMRITHLRRPEYAMAGTWLLAQLAIVVAISLSAGPRVYTLSILVFPMLVAAAVFPRRVVAAGTAITAALMLVAAFAFMPSTVAAEPPALIFPIVLLIVIAMLAARLTGADEDSRHSVIVDHLTGLLNRAALQARAAELTQHLGGAGGAGGAQVALILCDVDHFKAVNDEHGHAAGDAVLIEVARRLTGVVGHGGSLYRFGGEEFIVLLEGSGAERAGALAEQMRIAVAREVVAGLPLTVSLGVVASTIQTRDYPALLAAADRALYQAKSAGRDRVQVAEPGGAPPIPAERAAATEGADRRQRSSTLPAPPPTWSPPARRRPACPPPARIHDCTRPREGAAPSSTPRPSGST